MPHDECSQEELESFAKWMAIAHEIMRVDRDLLLQLRGLDEVELDDTTDRPDEL